LSSELDDSESFSSNISITDKENSDYDIDESNIHIDFGNDQCVITEVIDGKLKKYSNLTFRSIKQMMGIWELDFDMVDGILKQRSDYAYALQFLGVCSSHFNFDQDGLHTRGSKSNISIGKSIIHKRRCLFCYNECYYFSRGGRCSFHSWSVMERNVYNPCCGVKKEGGHFFKRRGKGAKLYNCNDEHTNDKAKSLELLDHYLRKKELLKDNNEITEEHEKTHKTPDPSSYLVIKIALRLKKVCIKDDDFTITKLVQKYPRKFGEALTR
ncbi:6752_t:CDS:2, partial [Ambispora gerdemannii]